MAGGVLSAGAASAAASPAEGTLNYNPAMRYRKLGKTDLWISELSFGGHWRTREGERYWGSFPNDKVPADVQRNREDVFGRAIDLGLNYLDITTPAEATAYGNAMKGLGQRMYVGYSDYILCIRDPNRRTVDAMMFEIDEGLKRLQIDCLDIWRPQADMGGNHTDDEINRVVETFHKAKDQGKVKHLGISSHSRDFTIRLMTGFPDFEMFIFPYTFGSEMDPEHSVFPMVRERNCGLVCIKPFAGGSLFRLERRQLGDKFDGNEVATRALRKILSNEYLTASIPGQTTIEELENNVSVRKMPKQLTEAEHASLREIARETMASLPADYQWLRQWEYV
jgi:predicted aldo/keto reductase-like oxidoreductase